MSQKITRRRMLQVLGTGSALTALAACAPAAPKATEAPKAEAPKAEATQAEAPVAATEAPKPTEAPATSAPKLITYVDSAGFGSPPYKEAQDPIAKALSEKMQQEGINLEYRIMLLDNPKEKYPVLYASGTPFTFAFDAPWYFMNSLRDQGHLRPLEPYLGKYPNIVKAIGAPVIDFNYMLGHLYGLPTGFYVGGGVSGMVYRLDLAEKYGMKELKNMDDFELFLAEVKKNEPDMIPFGADDTFNAAYHGACPWRTWLPTRHGYNPGGAMIGGGVEEGLNNPPKYVGGETQPGFTIGFERAKDWYDKGWVNKNVLQLKVEQTVEELFNPGKCAAIAYNEPAIKAEQTIQPGLQSFNAKAKAAGFSVVGDIEGGVVNFAMLKQWNFQVFNSHVPEEDTLAGLQFFDWMLASQDNIDIYLFGIDGVNYKKLPSMKYADIPGVDGTTNYRRRWYVAGVPGQFERVPENASENFTKTLAFITNLDNFVTNPLEKFEPDRKPKENELAQLTAANKEYSLPLMAGQIDLKEGVDKYVKALKDAKRDEVMAEFQTQLDKWVADNKTEYEATLAKAKTQYDTWKSTKFAEYIKAHPEKKPEPPAEG